MAAIAIGPQFVYSRVTMQIRKFLSGSLARTLFVSSAALMVAHAFAGSETNPMVEKPAAKISPHLAPEYVAFLKEQASARDAFFHDEAKSKSELKERHSKDYRELLTRHREARASFSKDKHSPTERASFFNSQRSEMAELRAKQKKERGEFESEIKKKSSDFHKRQKQEELDLRQKLIKSSFEPEKK